LILPVPVKENKVSEKPVTTSAPSTTTETKTTPEPVASVQPENKTNDKLRGILDKLFGDFILKHYKKKDLAEQSIYNTDFARLNFIIKILADNEPLWKKDLKGINTQKIIIIPMLTYTEELINNYIKKYSKRNFVENVNMKRYTQVMDKVAILMQIQQLISSKKLEKNKKEPKKRKK